MHVLFVGDGERDAVTVPPLVEKILGVGCGETSIRWARLHGTRRGREPSRGYEAKLNFAIRQAKDQRADGLVATIDRDRDERNERIASLEIARESLRASAHYVPTAIGQAIPHGEAWLLDDPSAVREAMKLMSDQSIPSVNRTKNPKSELERVLSESPRRHEKPLHVWADIASLIDITRLQHARDTGFAVFADDVRREIGPIAAKNSPATSPPPVS